MELADALQVGERLDVAYRASDFGNHEVELVLDAQLLDVALDFVGDVGHHLDGLPQIVATAFFFDDVLVDAPGGDVVGMGGADACETLVVPQVKVGFQSVFRHVALAVLIGVERAGVDVDVGVKLLDGDVVASCLKQFSDGGGDDAFSQ